MKTRTDYGESGAVVLSEDRVYRYTLTREWDSKRPRGAFIGLNPSTADESRLDPTLRRVCRFLDREGCGSMVILNLFALRARDPRAMLAAKDPIGPDNDEWIKNVAVGVEGPILVGWGNGGGYIHRAARVRDMLPNIKGFCLGLTTQGQPKHPLYIASAAPFVPWP